MAPSTPPPPSSDELAAFTIAVTASLVMSSCIAVSCAVIPVGFALCSIVILADRIPPVKAESNNRRFDLNETATFFDGVLPKALTSSG
jgi:hypothetical protein